MLFAMLAAAVALAAAWSAWRWRRGATGPDPAARLLATVAFGLLGAGVALGPWAWVTERYGPWFWGPFAGAAALFVGAWARERRRR
jgi:hypothetical protein